PLVESLRRHLRADGRAEAAEEALRAADLSLLAAPDAAAERAWPDLAGADLAEARAGEVWLACCRGQATPAMAEELENLARRPLWPPALALALRGLALLDQRRLSCVLPRQGPLSLAQADAWLEAAHPDVPDASWASRLCPEAD